MDCDVLQADGGTRTASITGAYVALADAVAWLRERRALAGRRAADRLSVAAISVGVIDGEVRHARSALRGGLPNAEVDLNVVATGTGELIEVQGTAEGKPFSRDVLNQLLDLGLAGCADLTRLQQEALGLGR